MGKEIVPQRLGRKLRDLREAKKLTQEELSQKLNISRKTVSKWENGVGLPSIQFIKDVADFYGVTIDDILKM